ncbi:unnamed protein product [Agarophyton chilense]
MVGGMGVRKNVHIEEWASFRENCEHAFKFSRANWARLAVFGFAVPIGLYVWITKEMLCEGHSEGLGPERFGYQRKYMGFPPQKRQEP